MRSSSTSDLHLSEVEVPLTAAYFGYFESPRNACAGCAVLFLVPRQFPLPGELVFRDIPGAQTLLMTLTSGQPRRGPVFSREFHVRMCPGSNKVPHSGLRVFSYRN